MVFLKLDSNIQKDETRPLLHYTKKNYPKWIKYLNARPETTKLLEENIGSMHFDSGLSDTFLDLSPQAREAKVKMNKWD